MFLWVYVKYFLCNQLLFQFLLCHLSRRMSFGQSLALWKFTSSKCNNFKLCRYDVFCPKCCISNTYKIWINNFLSPELQETDIKFKDNACGAVGLHCSHRDPAFSTYASFFPSGSLPPSPHLYSPYPIGFIITKILWICLLPLKLLHTYSILSAVCYYRYCTLVLKD